ncbi:MAG: amino acid ABC transporter substrate-binding protein [Alphaproteobacteria bacterium]|nr:MAG: amino acid ABC transporter substrate-binding protein [Alphaproteobacteria bacterium]
MLTHITRRAAVIAGAALLVAAGQPVQAQDVKLGAILSATGGLARFVPPIRDGIRAAIEDVNANGGILNGRRVVLVEGDDQTTPQGAVEAANRLVNLEQVPAIVGPLGSGMLLAAANSVTIGAGVVLMSPSATNPSITGLADNDTVFRVVGGDDFQGKVLAKIARDRGLTRVAVMAEATDYARGFVQHFVPEFQRRGGTVTQNMVVESNRASYRSELATAAQGNPQALVLIAYPQSGGTTITRQALEGGFFDTFVMSEGTREGAFVREVGAANLAKSFGTASAEPPTDAGALERYTAVYRRVSQADPNAPFVRQAYDAAMILLLAMEAAKSTDRAAIKAAIRTVSNGPGEVVGPGEWARAKQLIAAGTKINYQGISGNHEFDAAGDVAGYVGIWSVAAPDQTPFGSYVNSLD